MFYIDPQRIMLKLDKRKNCTVKISWLNKWGACIGLIGGLIGAFSGGLSLYDRLTQPELKIIGVAPIAVWARNQDTETNSHGISLIVRVQNKGSKPAYFVGSDIHGKAYLNYNEYWPICRQKNDCRTSDKLKLDFKSRRPYRFISWIGWFTDHRGPMRIEPGEERFVKVTFAEPVLCHGVYSYSGGSSDEFVGYEDSGVPPKLVNHTPALDWFFKIFSTETSHYPGDIRDEVKNGLIKIEIRCGTKENFVDPQKIVAFKHITDAAWEGLSARKIYYDIN